MNNRISTPSFEQIHRVTQIEQDDHRDEVNRYKQMYAELSVACSDINVQLGKCLQEEPRPSFHETLKAKLEQNPNLGNVSRLLPPNEDDWGNAT